MKALFVLIMVLTLAGSLEAIDTYHPISSPVINVNISRYPPIRSARVPAPNIGPDWTGITGLILQRAQLDEQERANKATERLLELQIKNDQQNHTPVTSRANQENSLENQKMRAARQELELEKRKLVREREQLQQQSRETRQYTPQPAKENSQILHTYTTPNINVGDSRENVISTWGNPKGFMKDEALIETLMYDQGVVVIEYDKVIKVKLRKGYSFSGRITANDK